LRRWAEHFSKLDEVMVVSDSRDEVPGVRFEPIFAVDSRLSKLRRLFWLRRLVKEFKPDVVHGHYLTVGGFYASLSGGKRIVGSAWGSDVYHDPERSFTNRMILRFALRRCDLVFAGSKDAAEAVHKFGYKGEVPIVRFGVDPEKFKRTSRHGTDEFRILSPRHCSSIYNPLVIIDAFKKMLPRMANAYLYLVESGNQLAEVHERVETDPELAKHVRFYSWKPYGEMPALYGAMDLAISIPNSDSVAASVIESMACEVPVIASDIPNMRELVEPGTTGYLTRIDVDSVADMMLKAYSVRKLLPEIGKRARAKVVNPTTHVTWDSNMRVAQDAYERLIKEIPVR